MAGMNAAADAVQREQSIWYDPGINTSPTEISTATALLKLRVPVLPSEPPDSIVMAPDDMPSEALPDATVTSPLDGL